MVYKIFPTHLGRNIPNRISQLKFHKLTFKFTNSRFSQQQNFLQKSYQNFTKSSKLFPNEKQTFPHELFKFSQESDHLNKGRRFPNLKFSSGCHLEQTPCLLRPGIGNKCEVCDKTRTTASNMGEHISQ